MRITKCDICKDVIECTDEKYIFAFQKAKEPNSETSRISQFKGIYDDLSSNNKKTNTLRFYEICEECKWIIDFMLVSRVDKIQKMKKTIKKMMGIKSKVKE